MCLEESRRQPSLFKSLVVTRVVRIKSTYACPHFYIFTDEHERIELGYTSDYK